MKYLSICSGIEAASVAWKPLKWVPHAFAEIESFPSAVLAHHYGSNLPNGQLSTDAPPNYGDITKFKEWPNANIDVLVGGTPCQSFSVAGLRKGLADPRGNLCLTFLAIADKYRPSWIIWENVPGVLSSGQGRDFGAFLGGLGQLGYGWAYRVLDAQYVRVDGFPRAVPQRRRRVFVVGHLGDWRCSAAVLFEREGMLGNSPPRRKAGERIADSLTVGANQYSGFQGEPVVGALDARHAGGFQSVQSAGAGHLLPIAFSSKDYGADATNDLAPTLRAMPHNESHANAGGQLAIAFSLMPMNSGKDFKGRETDIAQPIMAAGPTGGNQGGDYIVHAIQERAISENAANGPDGIGVRTDGAAYTIEARQVPQAVAFVQNSRDEVRLFNGDGQTVGALAAQSRIKQQTYVAPSFGINGVRRLMPIECERLQGFPDGYTDISYRGKRAADGPRYKALGNSMAVNVMRWIGRRIESVECISKSKV
jgi:DNA (cytosine-5)-methyltransferase 1